MDSGSQLGPYEIKEPLGEGGMGEVYRAHDGTLRRDVAIKLLPEDVADDPERLGRLKREARALATLNDPHIATVHGFEEHDGTAFIVMELVGGETLAEKLERGPLPVQETLDLGIQIVKGLESAHEHGIVHRDLKPANVKIMPSGEAKVLDFGLAKPLRTESGGSESRLPTATVEATRTGAVMGTPPYMSPEQIRGEEIDQRTDIWAFGCVLYEMLEGETPFGRETPSDTLAAILRDPCPSLSRQAPAALVEVIRRCLTREPARRYRTAGEVRAALEMLHSGIDGSWAEATAESRAHRAGVETAPARRFVRGRSLLLLGVLWTAVAIAATALLMRAPGDPAAVRASQLTFDSGAETAPSLSPDGKTLVFVKGTAPRRQIFLQRVDGSSAIPLSSSADHDDHDPMYSPDGSQIVFRSERDGGGIFVMGATGESVRRLTSRGHNPSWSPDGSEIFFVSEELNSPTIRLLRSAISKVVVATGAVEEVFEGDAMQPMVSPNGKRIAYWALSRRGGGQRDIYTVAVNGDPNTIVPATNDEHLDWNPVWEPDGNSILFASDRGGSMNVWRLPIDEETGEPGGAPEPLGVPATWTGRISVARDGSAIAYESAIRTQELRMGRFDEETGTFQMTSSPVLSGSMLVRTAEPSPDGQRIAFTTEGYEDVYVIDADGSNLRQLTNDSARDRGVSWGADGSRIYFYSTRDGDFQAWSIRPDGSGLEQHTRGLQANYPSVSPDGRNLAVHDGITNRGLIFPLGDDPVARSQAITLPPLPDGSGFWPLGWSPDGTELIGVPFRMTDLRFFIYSLADQRYEELMLSARGRLSVRTPWRPAKFMDRDRIVLSLPNEVVIFDRSTGEARHAFAAKSATFDRNGRFVLTASNRHESDLWHMTLRD